MLPKFVLNDGIDDTIDVFLDPKELKELAGLSGGSDCVPDPVGILNEDVSVKPDVGRNFCVGVVEVVPILNPTFSTLIR